ncbi:MAG: bacterial transcriptional activator domain-containing protein [Intrasporangium sp.]|uniref:AfsR/SARP family transcriptional regulator n=1 Tax=Intrasporangium sp. TaxID=1925024 RepID=UPI0026498982|nr:bacterial transcriptional activator domain-containing protein [Intrasporangium sp.]MDN5794375.1 bacterial transcriptional activator domain-containing protein [Intrasporangium sp.]
MRTEPTGPTTVSLVRDFEIRSGGAVLDLPPIAQRVICFLAIHSRPVRRPFVSGSLWPDTDERRASASLRSALWRVPSPGGQPIVCTSSTHVWLDESVAVDVHGLIDASATMFQPGREPPTWTEVARILLAYGHDLLTGWYDEWALAERERFRQVRLHVLDRIGERLFTDGRCDEALEVALTVVAAEPLRESTQRLLVRIHLHEGNVAEAFRIYCAYAERLDKEVGAAPSPVMTGLLLPYCHPSRLEHHAGSATGSHGLSPADSVVRQQPR